MKQQTLTLFTITCTFYLIFTGCSTTANLIGYRDQKTEIYGGIKHLGVEDHKNTGMATYALSGKSKSDERSITNCTDQIVLFPIIFFEWFVDFPFSFVADTLVLPYTIPVVSVRDLLDEEKSDFDKMLEKNKIDDSDEKTDD